jgi:hypothetical protein
VCGGGGRVASLGLHVAQPVISSRLDKHICLLATWWIILGRDMRGRGERGGGVTREMHVDG